VPEPEILWISREWQDKIIAAIDPIDQPIFQFLRFYGCRPGEARALMWDAVDLEKELVTFKRTFSWSTLREYTKSKRIRTLPMDQEIKSLLEGLKASAKVVSLGGEPTGFVFLGRREKPYTVNLSRIWNEARDKVGCPKKIKLYQGIRHSRGTQWIEEGKSMELVRAWLGHTGDNMTRRYAKVTGKGLKGLVE
jgi:integrase